jgi:glycosyltransferase involved in cell wall biosynthesis
MLAYRDFPWHTGLSWRMEGVIKQLSKKGFSVVVIVPLICGFEKMDMPNVVFERIYLGWLRKKSVLRKIVAFFSWVYFQLRCMIKILKYAKNTLLVQYEHYYCFPTAYFTKAALKIPVIADDISLLHIRPGLTGFKRKIFYVVERLIAEKSSLLITASNIAKEVIEERFPTAKLFYLPNGVEKISFKKMQREKCIIFVGNLHFEQNVKAVQNVFEIVQRLVKRRTDFKVYIIGSPLEPVKHLLVH